ncbi:hypothetical protein GHT09_019890 [Marmota monax]|uniref:Uncharacterized protein n=1 Tax=Marmota monax TaxID=9995 RepID=A0A834PJ83_MARMO|nr:hypothetical protein GHT09_019890 [Marmota monax]
MRGEAASPLVSLLDPGQHRHGSEGWHSGSQRPRPCPVQHMGEQGHQPQADSSVSREAPPGGGSGDSLPRSSAGSLPGKAAGSGQQFPQEEPQWPRGPPPPAPPWCTLSRGQVERPQKVVGALSGDGRYLAAVLHPCGHRQDMWGLLRITACGAAPLGQ